MKTSLLTFGAVAILATASAHADTIIYPGDNGFEVPNLGMSPAAVFQGWNGSTVTPLTVTGNPWVFTVYGQDGITTNGSDYGTTGATNGNNDGPDGAIGTTSDLGQAALLNDDPTSSFYQTMALGVGSYTVDFEIEGRNFGGPAGLPVEVGIADDDGSNFIDLGTFYPDSTSSFNSVVSDSFTIATAGDYQLTFENGAANGPLADQVYYPNDSVDIDNVSLEEATIPEPSTWADVAFGVGLLGLYLRRKKNLA